MLCETVSCSTLCHSLAQCFTLGVECLLRAQHGKCRREEVAQVFSTPLLELVFHAARVHRMYNDPQMVRAGSIAAGSLPQCHVHRGSSYLAYAAHPLTGCDASQGSSLVSLYRLPCRA